MLLALVLGSLVKTSDTIKKKKSIRMSGFRATGHAQRPPTRPALNSLPRSITTPYGRDISPLQIYPRFFFIISLRDMRQTGREPLTPASSLPRPFRFPPSPPLPAYAWYAGYFFLNVPNCWSALIHLREEQSFLSKETTREKRPGPGCSKAS